MAAVGDPAYAQFGIGDADVLIGAGIAEIHHFERPVDHQHIEPEESEHRPRAHQQECDAGGKTHHAEKAHQHDEAGPIQRPVRASGVP